LNSIFVASNGINLRKVRLISPFIRHAWRKLTVSVVFSEPLHMIGQQNAAFSGHGAAFETR
jgi:hypothetical protein